MTTIEQAARTVYSDEHKNLAGCFFCNTYEALVLHETEHFRVIMDCFPVVPGHMMISSKLHYGCAGEIPEERFSELLRLKELVKREVRRLGGGHAIFYEHGRAGYCTSINPLQEKCEHFHLHCIPMKMALPTDLQHRFEELPLLNYRAIRPLFMEEGSYLYFEESCGRMSFFPTDDEEVPPHHLRTLVCKELGKPECANWRDYSDRQLLEESARLIEKEVSFGSREEYDDLS